MSDVEVTVVRIYVTEGDAALKQVLDFLHDESDVMGVTLFRGVMGFGKSHAIHSARLLDLSLDLPMIVEFFDRPERAAAIMPRLRSLVPEGHLLHWSARVNDGAGG